MRNRAKKFENFLKKLYNINIKDKKKIFKRSLHSVKERGQYGKDDKKDVF